MKPVVRLTDVTKQFNKFKAVDSISFSIREGSIYGLLGPNGAGKTTTIRMMMRIIYPDAGSIEIFGNPLKDVQKDHIEVCYGRKGCLELVEAQKKALGL